MNDLVNMAVNLKVPNTKINNTSKETLKTEKSNIDTISQKNHSSNFKKILNKANEKTNLKNSEVYKDEEIEDVKNDSSKEVKSKKDVLDLILISLLQHLGDDKIDIKKAMEELNEGDSSTEDVTTNIMNLIGNANIGEIDIEGLKSSNNLQKSVDDIINALLNEAKSSNNENSKLQELLSKMKAINDEDINNLNIKEAINDLTSTFMEASNEEDSQGEIIDVINFMDNKNIYYSGKLKSYIDLRKNVKIINTLLNKSKKTSELNELLSKIKDTDYLDYNNLNMKKVLYDLKSAFIEIIKKEEYFSSEDVINEFKSSNDENSNLQEVLSKVKSINSLNSVLMEIKKEYYSKPEDVINEFKSSNDENSNLQELLGKMKSINDEDINNLNIKEDINDLKSTFMEASKEVKQDRFMKENILNLIKDKLNESSMDKSNRLNIMESFRNKDSLKTVTQMENFNSDSNAGYENKEEEFLKGLTSNNKSKLQSKLDKVTNFMNDFNKINSEISTNKVEVEAPININKNNLVNDFIKSVKYMEQNNVKEMTVKVKPQELGEVVIRLTVENGLMKANISANNKEAYNLLNSKLQDLNNSLGNGEIKIQNFTIDIYNGDTTFFSRENSREQRNNSNGNSRAKNSEVLQVENSLNSNDEMQNHLEDSNVNAFV